jgi:hypothetical protein
MLEKKRKVDENVGQPLFMLISVYVYTCKIALLRCTKKQKLENLY